MERKLNVIWLILIPIAIALIWYGFWLLIQWTIAQGLVTAIVLAIVILGIVFTGLLIVTILLITLFFGIAYNFVFWNT